MEQQISDSGRSLTVALVAASNGGVTQVRRFYEEFLRSSVWVPLDERGLSERATGASTFFEQMKFLVVKHQGRKVIPVFSEEAFASVWAGGPQTVELRDLSSLIRVLPQEVWLYLNPSQECGKEISPWELGLLLLGEQSIPELLEEFLDESPTEIEIAPEPPRFSFETEERVRQILESYPDVREAFRVLVRRSEGANYSVMFGLSEIPSDSEKERNIKEELIEAVRSEGVEAEVVSSSSSMNRMIFNDRTPFYIRQEELNPPLSRDSSTVVPWWKRLFLAK